MITTSFGTRMLIDKSDITKSWLDDLPPRELAPGEILFDIDFVALTSNNITYAAGGDRFGYWSFFPDDSAAGIVPVWGFATVAHSAAHSIEPGERFYGYWPLAEQLVCPSSDISRHGFTDPSAHRQKLGPLYNRYVRTSTDPSYAADNEAMLALFRPLFMTGLLIERFLAQQAFFGGDQIILSSASSKTALSAAFMLKQNHGGAVQIVGLTSPDNMSFVASLGSYDVVRPYADIASLPANVPAVFMDFAGSRATTAAVHQHFGAALKHSAVVGITNWTDQQIRPAALPGPEPKLFFAPSVAEAEITELGRSGFAAVQAQAWSQFAPHAAQHIEVVTHYGMGEACAAYQDMARGGVSARSGIILKIG